MAKLECTNASKIEPIKITGKVIRGKRADTLICSHEKELFIVTYQYRELDTNTYENDTIIIKAHSNLDVHTYMDKCRREFIVCGYDMQYNFQKVGEGNFVEI